MKMKTNTVEHHHFLLFPKAHLTGKNLKLIFKKSIKKRAKKQPQQNNKKQRTTTYNKKFEEIVS